MSDYLSNLAAKSLNLTAVIQPRPVSLFEPPPAARWSASSHSFGLETVGRDEASGEGAFDAPPPTHLAAGHWLAAGPSVADLRLPPEREAHQPDDLSGIPDWRFGPSTGEQRPLAASSVPQSTETRPGQHASQPGRAEGQPTSSQTPGPISPPGPPRPDRPTLSPAAAGNETDTTRPRSAERQRRSEGQPAPGREPSASSQTRELISHARAPRRDRPTLTPADPSDETGATSPRSAERQRRPESQPPPPILRPAAAQPSGGRMPQQPEPDRATLNPAAAADETRGTPPRTTPEGQNQLALKPLIRHIVIDRNASPAEPQPTAPPLTEQRAVRETYPSIPDSVLTPRQIVAHVKPIAPPTPTESAVKPQAAPTIQVTIGRVEVRATPLPPSSKPRRPAPPVMSLDEYLQQRAGGDRR